MLNRHNLQIAALATKEQSRYSLDCILVTPERTVVTDGRCLITVTTPDIPEDNVPHMEGVSPTNTFVPFQMPAADALAIAKALPRKTTLPVLENAFVDPGNDQIAKVAVVKDKSPIGCPTIFNVQKTPGRYPNYERVIPETAEAEISICVNATLLASVLQTLAPIAGALHGSPVYLRIKDPESQIRIDCGNADTGQKAIGVVMPMLNDKAQVHGVPARLVTVELLDGRVRNIYCDRPLEVTVVEHLYNKERDESPPTGGQVWKLPDISRIDSMPEALREFIAKQLTPAESPAPEAEPAADLVPEPEPVAAAASDSPAPAPGAGAEKKRYLVILEGKRARARKGAPAGEPEPASEPAPKPAAPAPEPLAELARAPQTAPKALPRPENVSPATTLPTPEALAAPAPAGEPKPEPAGDLAGLPARLKAHKTRIDARGPLPEPALAVSYPTSKIKSIEWQRGIPAPAPKPSPRPAAKPSPGANGWDNPEVRAKRIAAIRAARAAKAVA